MLCTKQPTPSSHQGSSSHLAGVACHSCKPQVQTSKALICLRVGTHIVDLCYVWRLLQPSRCAGSGETQRDQAAPTQLLIQSPSSGLFGCFALHCGFNPVSLQPTQGSSLQARFGVALWSNLPVVLPIAKLEVRFDIVALRALAC